MVDKVYSGIGLSYRPACLCSLAGRYDKPYAGVNKGDYEFGYCVFSQHHSRTQRNLRVAKKSIALHKVLDKPFKIPL